MAKYIKVETATQYHFKNPISYNAFVKLLERMPGEDVVERKTGKWEKKWHSLLKEELPCCSECHHFSRMRWYYCPWCGAEMEREAEDGGSD